MDKQTKIDLFRKRFYGRQDVYGLRWEAVFDGESKVRGGYAPVCDNHYKEFCHKKVKDGVQCSQCNHKKWAPVTDAVVWKHISGEEVHIYYVLQQDGSVRFAALDFDMKPGKEDKGYSFEDVKKVSELITSYKIPHYIARSTTAGYHLYFFFEEFYAANKFRSFIIEVYERLGFMEALRISGRPLPEFFPKQSYVGRDGIGNGIKPPMIEPKLSEGRNCWVDSDDNVISDQWGYFSNMRSITTEMFDKMLEDQNIPITEEGIFSAGGTTSSTSSTQGSYSNKPTKWQPPITGSVEKVLEGCSAFRKIRDKVLKGEVLGHSEGFALYHICMHTQDGLEWFKSKVKGWGENDKDLRQLQHSLEKNYLPWTCKKLQEQGICPAGTQCFEKKPPREIVDGIEVYRDDIPKDKWPEPSPIRYSLGKGEDFLLKLQKEVVELKEEKDSEVKQEKLKEIAKRAQVFDGTQQKEFKDFVRTEKPLKRNEISKIFNEASDLHEEDAKKRLRSRTDSMVFDDHMYLKAEPFGYIFVKSVKDKPKQIKLCSFDLVIQQVRTYLDGGKVSRSMYYGLVKMPGIEKSFEIDIDEWLDNTKFMSYFGKLLGHKFSPIRQNLEFIRQAALGFSDALGVDHQSYLMTQGYYDDTYLMPSLIVDANSVRPNTTNYVDLKFKETRHLDFKLLSEGDLQTLLIHIKKDFLSCWPEPWTYVGLAHTLLPAIMSPLDWTKKVTLFYEGLTGGGKSELTHSLQYFWGKFDSIANFFSSPKGIRELGYQFKDACVVIDDYKGLSKEQIAAAKECILNAYDGTSDFKLQKNSEFRTAKQTRGIYIMSGEEFITHDAATVARTVLVETHKHNTKETQRKYESVRTNRINYCGITPHFISWFLKQDRKEILRNFEITRNKLREKYLGAQNIDRVSNNLAMNYTSWSLFTSFLVSMNVASFLEKEFMDMRHWDHMTLIRGSMIERCAQEQSSEVFIRVLSELISAGEVSIDNLSGCSHERKPLIGFIPKEYEGQNTVCFFPDIVLEIVKNFCRSSPIHGNKNAILRQLEDQGAIADSDKGRLTKNMRYKNKQHRIWALKMTALGMDPAMSQEIAKVIELRPAMVGKKDSEGIY